MIAVQLPAAYRWAISYGLAPENPGRTSSTARAVLSAWLTADCVTCSSAASSLCVIVVASARSVRW